MSHSTHKAFRARSLLVDLLEEAHGLARGAAEGGFAELRAAWLAQGRQPALPILLYGWNLNAPVVFLAAAPDPDLLDFAPRLLRGGRAADAIDPYLCYCAEKFERARRHGLLGTSGRGGAWHPATVWNRAEALLQEWLGEEARMGEHGLWLHAMPYILEDRPPLRRDVLERFAAPVRAALDLIRPALVVEVEDGAGAWLVRQRGTSEGLSGLPLEQSFPVLGRLDDPASGTMAAAVAKRLRRPVRAHDVLYRPAGVDLGQAVASAAN